MTVTNELIDSLLADYKKPEDLIGENGLLKLLTKKLVERALQAEMAEHLGYAKNDTVANAAGNTRNGKSKKTLKGDFGELPIEIRRDRHGSFEPQIVTKHQTRSAVSIQKNLDHLELELGLVLPHVTPFFVQLLMVSLYPRRFSCAKHQFGLDPKRRPLDVGFQAFRSPIQ